MGGRGNYQVSEKGDSGVKGERGEKCVKGENVDKGERDQRIESCEIRVIKVGEMKKLKDVR